MNKLHMPQMSTGWVHKFCDRKPLGIELAGFPIQGQKHTFKHNCTFEVPIAC